MKQRKNDNIIYLDRYRKKSWGKYALLHRDFLRDYHPKFYKQLLALGRLDEWRITAV